MKKKTIEDFLEKAKLIHGDRYDYSIVNYISNSSKVKIICRIHGEFEQAPVKHLNEAQNCPKCSFEKNHNEQRKTITNFISEAKLIHGDKYDYSNVIYNNYKEDIKIICKIHGEFSQSPSNHLQGKGCRYCGGTAKLDILSFIEKAEQIHGDIFDYSKTEYEKSCKLIEIVCPEHGKFQQTPNNFLSKKYGCPKCNKILTKFEIEVSDFLKALNLQINLNTRKKIPPLELDIFIPVHNLAIELNGLYWHDERFKENNYHLNKTELCEKKGIKLIHIFEDEWIYKKEIVKSRLKNLLGLTENRIFARKCEIRVVNSINSKEFLDKNHIQGDVKSSFKIGLYYHDELVSIMTLGKRPLINKSEYELIRFCNKLNTSVIGGADKLLKHFIKTHNPKEIISYADRRWSQGDLYEKLGFEFIHDTKPNYWYVIGLNRLSRFKFQKHLLLKENFNKNQSEHKIMLNRKIYRIYDCGHKCYKITRK